MKGIGTAAIAVGGVSGVAAARPDTPNTVFALDFDAAADAGGVGANHAGWLVDRHAPGAWATASFDGDDRLRIDVDASGPTTGFSRYQGEKYLPEDGGHWSTGHNSTLQYRFYVDPAWESDGVGQQTGMWCVLGDANENVVAYSILEYQDGDATGDGPQFRLFTQTGEWTDLGLPRRTRVAPVDGGWVTVEARFHVAGGHPRVLWSVNDALLAVDDTIDTYGDPAVFLEPILNSRNFGAEQVYYYDDVVLSAPGRR